MRIQPAFLPAVVVSFLVPFSASADDEQHSLGVETKEVYLQRAVPTNKAVRIAQLGIEPHGIVGRHCHSGDEIGIVTEGTVMLRVGDAEYEAKHQGEWFKVVPNTQMTVKNDTDKTARLYSVLVVEDDGEWLKHDPKNCMEK
jgi:quercetin dioxygenase-like cupin family protein